MDVNKFETSGSKSERKRHRPGSSESRTRDLNAVNGSISCHLENPATDVYARCRL